MIDLAVAIKNITTPIVRTDIFTTPAVLLGDPSLISITIHMDQAAAICSADFRLVSGIGPRPISSSVNPAYPIRITREQFGWLFDGAIAISTSAITPVCIILQYLDRDVYREALNVRF